MLGLRHGEYRAGLGMTQALGVHQQRGLAHAGAQGLQLFQQLVQVHGVFGPPGRLTVSTLSMAPYVDPAEPMLNRLPT